MDDIIGKIIAERYRVESFLGKGGMAEVYKVWDQKRSVYLALKILHADLAEDIVFLRRFKREAQTLAKLQHPNIVRFYGLEQADGLVFILMEYVEGTTLRKEIFETDKPLTMGRILQVMRPVCAALNYAHKSGFVHCDVKPANIMLHKNGSVYVADFGIARMTETATVTMVGAGTPAYMSPEQVRGETPIPQTDIYALGIILFEMLTGGERPFTGENAKTGGSTSEKIRWEQMCLVPPPPSKFNHLITPTMDRIILKCLEKEPKNRYHDVSALLNDLKSAVRDDLPEPTIRIARPQQVDLGTLVTQPGEEIKIPVRKQKLSAVLVVVLLIFILGIVSALRILGITALKQFNATQSPIPIMTQITPSPEPVITTSSTPTLFPSEAPEPIPMPSLTLIPPTTTTPLISIATLELGYSTIMANNSCGTRIFVFETQNGYPIIEAYIEPNETFNLISVVKGEVSYQGKTWEGLWLETSGPFHADKYEIGWVWKHSCIKFLQGTSLVILNTDTLLFETATPNP